MPFTVAHSAVGIATYFSLNNSNCQELSKNKRVWLLLLLVFAANVPDLDFLPGIFIGDPNRFHHGASHSVAGGLIMVLLIFAMIKDMFREIEGKRVFLFLTLALLSHTVLDYFSFDSSKPFGVPLFWPLTSEYNISPYPLFLDINRSGDSGMGFVTSLFSLHNLVALIGEAIFGLVVILISQLVNNPSSKLLKVKLLLGIFCSAVLFIGFQFSFSLPSYQ